MSIQALSWALKQVTGSPISKLVLIKLADNYNEGSGLCYPSMEHIAQQTELSKTAVIRHIQKLEKAGLVTVRRQKLGTVSLPNRYGLAYIQNDATGGGSGCQPGGGSGCQPGGSGCQPGGVVADEDSNRNLKPENNHKSKERESISQTSTSSKPPKKEKVVIPEPVAEEIEIIQALIDANNRIPHGRPITKKVSDSWLAELRRLHAETGAAWEVIEKTMQFALADDWWKVKCLDMGFFSRNWTKIRSQMTQKGQGNGQRTREPAAYAGVREAVASGFWDD